MSGETPEKRFVQRMRELLVSLPYDMKVLCEAVSDDYLPVEARQIAAAATIYCLSPSDPVPDTLGLLGFADDAIVARIALRRLAVAAAEGGARYAERFPEQFAELDGDLELFASYLGEAMGWLESRFERYLHKTRYKGKDAAAYASVDGAGEFLYEELQDFTTRYEIDDEAASRLRSGGPIVELFTKRLAEAKRVG